jgi:hypothetical protein
MLVIVAATLVALGLRLLQLSRPGYLLGVTEYDDGPYFGSAVDLVHGVIPYRNFILVQPPGITLLMSPAALLSKVTGNTASAMAVGRILTTLASAAGVFLVGLLLRHRGLVAVIIGCGILAVYPDSVSTARTILVEPWLVLFCLLGCLAVFDRDHFASGKRLFWGGVAFGFAGAIEVWAIFPVIVVAALMLPRLGHLARYIGGVAVGFLVPVVPFVAIDPKRFYQSLYVAQVAPRAGSKRVPLWIRLKNMLGLVHIHTSGTLIALAALVLVAFIIVVIMASWMISGHGPALLDWFALATTVIIVANFLWPDQFHYHFSAFLAPFLALAIALPVARLLSDLQQRATKSQAPAARTLTQVTAGLAGLVFLLFGVSQAAFESHLNLRMSPIAAGADRIIPKGACVATDQVSYLLLSNRFLTNVPGCSRMIDGLGSDLAFSNGLKPGTGAGQVQAVRTMWLDAFKHAQFVWLSYNAYRRVAWSPPLKAYFKANFVTALKHGGHDTIYKRITTHG